MACRGTCKDSQAGLEIPRLVQGEVWVAVLAFIYRKNNKPEVFTEGCDKKLYHSAFWKGTRQTVFKNDYFNNIASFVVINAIITHAVNYFPPVGYKKKDWLCTKILKLEQWQYGL